MDFCLGKSAARLGNVNATFGNVKTRLGNFAGEPGNGKVRCEIEVSRFGGVDFG